MTEIVTIGWLTIDDIVLTDHSCRPGVLGGGALYSAIGAQIWGPRVGIHSVAGRPTADAVREAIRRRDLDVEGIGVIDGNGLQLWLLHESATDKQQVPKLGASKAEEMDEARGPLPSAYCGAHGFHVAPQTPAGSLEAVRRLRRLPGGNAAVTLDVLSDEFIDRRLYRDLGFLEGVTAFLPSESRGRTYLGSPRPATVDARAGRRARVSHRGKTGRPGLAGLRQWLRHPPPHPPCSGACRRYDRRR